VVPSPPEAVSGPQFPPDLVRVIDAWNGLSDPIKAGILALVNASVGAQNLETKNAGVENMGK
jgi:hypothetical protein